LNDNDNPAELAEALLPYALLDLGDTNDMARIAAFVAESMTGKAGVVEAVTEELAARMAKHYGR